MNKYLITTNDMDPRTALADKNGVHIKSPSGTLMALTRDGEDFVFSITNKKGETQSIELVGQLVYDLPELIAVLAMENPNMFDPVIIARVGEIVTLFPKC